MNESTETTESNVEPVAEPGHSAEDKFFGVRTKITKPSEEKKSEAKQADLELETDNSESGESSGELEDYQKTKNQKRIDTLKYERHEAERMRDEAVKVAQALNMYLIETGQSSPEDGFDLTILTLRPDDGGGPGGPYLPKADDIIDPWGNQFMVVSPGEINADFDVLSYGKDAAPGGEGVNSDLTH